LPPNGALIAFHLAGVAAGAGVALTADALLLAKWNGRLPSSLDARRLRAASRIVWCGMALLAASGSLLVVLDPLRYLASSKLLAKATIAVVLAGNGAFVHRRVLPLIERFPGEPVADVLEPRGRALLFASAAISAVSWPCALVLGALRRVPLSYRELMAGYLLLLVAAIVVAQVIGSRITAPGPRRSRNRLTRKRPLPGSS
jgi:hypothetical protein